MASTYYLFPTFGLKAIQLADILSTGGNCPSGYAVDPKRFTHYNTDGSPPVFWMESHYNIAVSSRTGRGDCSQASTVGNTVSGQAYNIDPLSLYPGGPATYFGRIGSSDNLQTFPSSSDVLSGAFPRCFAQNADAKQSTSNRSLNVCNLFDISTAPTITQLAVDNTASSSCDGLGGNTDGWSAVTINNRPCSKSNNTNDAPFYTIKYTDDYNVINAPTDYLGCDPSLTGLSSCKSDGNFVSCHVNAPYPINTTCPVCFHNTLSPITTQGPYNKNQSQAFQSDSYIGPGGCNEIKLDLTSLESSVCFASGCQANYSLCAQATPGDFPVQFSFVEYNFDNCDPNVCTPPSKGPYYCTFPGGSGSFQRIGDNTAAEHDFFAGCVSTTAGQRYSVGETYLCRDNPTVYVPSGSDAAPYQALQSTTSCFDSTQLKFYVAGPGVPAPGGLWTNGTNYNSLVAVRVVNNYQTPPTPLPLGNNYGNVISNRTTYPLTWFNTPNASMVLAANTESVNIITNISSKSNISYVSPQFFTALDQVFVCQATQTITMLSEQYDTLLFAGVEDGVVGNLPGSSTTLYVYAVEYVVPTSTSPSSIAFQVLGTTSATLSSEPPGSNFLFTISNYTALETDSFRLVPLANFNAAPPYFTIDGPAQSFAVLVLDITNFAQSQYYDNGTGTVTALNSSIVSVTDAKGNVTTGTTAFAGLFSANIRVVYVKSTFASCVIDIFYYDPTGNPAPAKSYDPTVLRLQILPVRNQSGTSLTALQITVLDTPQYNLHLSNKMDAAYPNKDNVFFTFAENIDYSNVYWFGMSTLFETDECRNYCATGTSDALTQCNNVVQQNQCGQYVGLDTMMCRAACFGKGVVVNSGGGSPTIASSGIYDCSADMLDYCALPSNVSSMCSCFAGSANNLSAFLSNPNLSTLANYKTLGLDSRFVDFLTTSFEQIAQNPYCSNPSCSSKAEFPDLAFQSTSCPLSFDIECLKCVNIKMDSSNNPEVGWICESAAALTSTCKVYNDFCYVYPAAGSSCGGGSNRKPDCNNCAGPATKWYLDPMNLLYIGIGLFVLVVLILVLFYRRTPAKQKKERQLKSLEAQLQSQRQQQLQQSITNRSKGLPSSKPVQQKLATSTSRGGLPPTTRPATTSSVAAKKTTVATTTVRTK